MFAEIYDLMDQYGGWLPYPDFVLRYFESVGAKHWADLYFREGGEKYVEEHQDQLKKFLQYPLVEI